MVEDIKKDRRVKEVTKNPCLLTAHVTPEMKSELVWLANRDGHTQWDLWLSLCLTEYLYSAPWQNLNYKFSKSLPKKKNGVEVVQVQCPFTVQPVVFYDGRSISGEDLRNKFSSLFEDLRARSVPAFTQELKPSSLSERSLTYSFYLWLLTYRFNNKKSKVFRPIMRFPLKDSFEDISEVLNDDE